MKPTRIFVETGNKKTFVGAVDWPGWCRSGRDEVSAMQSLFTYGSRYAQVLHDSDITFQAPTDPSDLIVMERHDGSSGTDFGVPAIILDSDRESLDAVAFERLPSILPACWQAFDQAIARARGKELQKGPRGGGRDLDKIIHHVLEADQVYLRRIAWSVKKRGEASPEEALEQTRQDILAALDVAATEGLPEKGPRGGVIWPASFFVRRVAWHVLDHAWEIDDRIL